MAGGLEEEKILTLPLDVFQISPGEEITGFRLSMEGRATSKNAAVMAEIAPEPVTSPQAP